MAFNPFLGQTKKQLETALRYAQADLLSGKATIGVRNDTTEAKMMADTSLMERIRMIQSALSILDPENYPPASVAMATQTRAAFA